MTGQHFKPLVTSKLLKWATKGLLIRLEPRSDAAPRLAEVPPPSSDSTTLKAVGTERKPDEILDMGAFSQLCEAAKASGLVPNVDMIAHVRDRAFRLGDYQKAFQIIEGLYSKFAAAATQRQQRLKREETDIASGKLKMSPKELQQKRARDTTDTQRIGRARTRFTRVMEGLRTLTRG